MDVKKYFGVNVEGKTMFLAPHGKDANIIHCGTLLSTQ